MFHFYKIRAHVLFLFRGIHFIRGAHTNTLNVLIKSSIKCRFEKRVYTFYRYYKTRTSKTSKILKIYRKKRTCCEKNRKEGIKSVLFTFKGIKTPGRDVVLFRQSLHMNRFWRPINTIVQRNDKPIVTNGNFIFFSQSVFFFILYSSSVLPDMSLCLSTCHYDRTI